MPSEALFPVVRARGAALGEAVRAWLMDAVRLEPGALVGLAVGDSTLPLYGALPGDDPAWERRRILPIDELLPSPADPARAFAARLRAALQPALAARVEDLPADVDARAARDGLCAVVLGLGPDGHVAFNQPGSGPDTGARIVALEPANLARLGDVSPATGALTMGIATILGAARVALVAAGDGKRAALSRVLDGPEGADVPASFLRRHPALTVFDAC